MVVVTILVVNILVVNIMVTILVVNIVIFRYFWASKINVIATKTISMKHLKEKDDSLVASVVPLTDTHAVFHLRLDCHGFRKSFFSLYQKANIKLFGKVEEEKKSCMMLMMLMTTDLWELLHNVVDLRRTKPHTTWIQSAVTPRDDFSHGIGFDT